MREGLKQREIQKCACCGEGIGHGGNLHFYCVTIETHVVNMPAVRRQTGLEMTIGSAALAAVMGPDEPISMVFAETRPALICFECALKRGVVELIEALPSVEVSE